MMAPHLTVKVPFGTIGGANEAILFRASVFFVS